MPFFPSSLGGEKHPPPKCHSQRLVIPCPVTQLASDTLQDRRVIRASLDPALTGEEVPPSPLGLAGGAVALLPPWLSPAGEASLVQLPLAAPLAAR